MSKLRVSALESLDAERSVEVKELVEASDLLPLSEQIESLSVDMLKRAVVIEDESELDSLSADLAIVTGGSVSRSFGIYSKEDGEWKRLYSGGEVNVLWFGAKGDGSTDDTTAIQAAHDTGLNVYYPNGNYLISESIKVTQGQVARGDKGLRFPNSALRSVVRNVNDSVPAFIQTSSDFSGQEDAFGMRELVLVSNHGVMLNDPNQLITDGASATTPYLMRPTFYRCSFLPRIAGSGTGVILSKCFDFIIEQCEFTNYDRHLVLQGCDIGRVSTNRFTGIHGYGILELSCDTFGSQNLIINNDMVGLPNPSARFIRSTARHVRIVDNYLEQQSGALVGFIDLSEVGVPQYGQNTPSETRYSSIVVEKNRLDGVYLASAFIYRITSGRLLNTKIQDSSTTGIPPIVPWLLDASGNSPELPVFWNTNHPSQYDISLPSGYFGTVPLKTSGLSRVGSSLIVPHTAFTNLDRQSLAGSGANLFLSISYWGAVVSRALGNNFLHLVLPVEGGVQNPYLRDGAGYRISVRVRSKGQAVPVQAVYLVNGGGVGSTAATTVGPQTQILSLNITGADSSSKVGVAIRFGVASPSDDLVIESITFTET